MIREMGKVKEKKILIQGINTTNHRAPSGHVVCGVATTHLVRNETPRVMDSSGKPFIFYGRHDMS